MNTTKSPEGESFSRVAQEIERFWRHLFGGQTGLLQVWTGVRDQNDEIPQSTIKSANFNYPKAAQQAAEYAVDKAQQAGREVYFCVHLLTSAQRSKENAAEIRTLWADLDGVPVPNGPLTPTALIESSPGHYHAYWRLIDAIPPETAEDLNRRLSYAIDADSGFHLGKLLRVPYTPNNKYADTLVRAEHITGDRACSPAELDELLPKLERPGANTEPEDGEESPVELPPEAMRVWRGEKPKLKDNGEINRSASLMKIGRVLYDAGANRRVVVSALEERDRALGWRKYADNRDGGHAEYQRIYGKLEAEGRNTRHNIFFGSASNASNASSQQESSAGIPDPLPFPLQALPPTTRAFVRETAASIDCSRDFVGMAVLAALSAAIGDTRRIIVKKRWLESAAIYSTMVGPPGSKKTPAMNAALLPIHDKQKDHKKLYDEEKEDYARELREQKAAKKDGAVSDKAPEKPTLRRTWVDDTTVERLAGILGENPRGVLLARDELSAWLRSMDQYKQGGKGSDRQFWLKAHSSIPAIVDRKSQEEPEIIPRPWVSIIGGIQPAVLPEFDGERGDGLLERFVFAYPQPYVGGWSDDEVSDKTQQCYEATIARLYKLRYATDGHGDPFPSKVPMSEEAKKAFVRQYNDLHQDMSNPEFSQALAPAWAKLDGLLARLALIIAMTRVVEYKMAGDTAYEEVTEADMDSALALLEYFKNHTSRTYASLAGGQSRERLAADLQAFLVDSGGVWEGSASELHAAFFVDYKPERPEDLAKLVRGVARRVSWLKVEDLPRVASRRPFRLTLLVAGIAGTAGSGEEA
jgi:hypothetical protein